MTEVQIHGTVEPGFESVKSLFELNMRKLKERQTQLCVYVKGQQVVRDGVLCVSTSTQIPNGQRARRSP